MRIGIDFDNTIAGYDRVFCAAARARGILCDAQDVDKLELRTRIRALDDGEEKWKALQGEVYGKRMKDAVMLPGVADFLKTCKRQQTNVFIVSHKTEHGHYDTDFINLRDAARAWMATQGFFDANIFQLSAKNVFFESTRMGKVNRIAELDCTHFIDDLEEVFAEPGFPTYTARILYDPSDHAVVHDGYEKHTSWQSIESAIFEP